jgi:hypothetical protein
VSKIRQHFLLGLVLNSVIAFVCIFPAGYIMLAFAFFAGSLPAGPDADYAGIIFLVAIALVVLLPFLLFNVYFSRSLKRRLISLYYEKSQIRRLQIKYWVGAVVFYCLPATVICLVMLIASLLS